ncbi:MAG: class I SAM-dependent methyltransferase [Candidatus Eremiobacteraeota bacterium]|nr:class I SAM-dependent methyltransferase [Candidatus Eremiobacteraeota bacterium]
MTQADMSRHQDLNALVARFSKGYQLCCCPALQEMERSVLGCDYGGTSWTTQGEAVHVAEVLELGPDMQLLEIGAGSGWPGLYLAQITGCDVLLTDVPFAGLQAALARASADGVGARCRVIGADAAELPFRDDSFDALSHSDVLCCLPDKLSVLMECRRVARAGAKMVFSVIAPAPGLSESDYREAIASGPAFVDVAGGYAQLLRDSDWRVLKRTDVTKEFGQTLRASVEELEARADVLANVLGSADFAERVQHRKATITAVERGLLQREIFVSTTSGPGRSPLVRSDGLAQNPIKRQDRR